jgi:hypothetical protein
VPGGVITVAMQVRGWGVVPSVRLTAGEDGLPVLELRQGMVSFSLSPLSAVGSGHVEFSAGLLAAVREFHEECVRLAARDEHDQAGPDSGLVAGEGPALSADR